MRKIIMANRAAEVFCPSRPHNCAGPACAAWIYVKPPEKEAYTTLSCDQANQAGILERSGLAMPDDKVIPAADIADAWERFYADFSELTVITDDFKAPHGDGWEPEGKPSFDNESGVFLMRYTRAEDSQATGICGMVPNTYITPSCGGCQHGA